MSSVDVPSDETNLLSTVYIIFRLMRLSSDSALIEIVKFIGTTLISNIIWNWEKFIILHENVSMEKYDGLWNLNISDGVRCESLLIIQGTRCVHERNDGIQFNASLRKFSTSTFESAIPCGVLPYRLDLCKLHNFRGNYGEVESDIEEYQSTSVACLFSVTIMEIKTIIIFNLVSNVRVYFPLSRTVQISSIDFLIEIENIFTIDLSILFFLNLRSCCNE